MMTEWLNYKNIFELIIFNYHSNIADNIVMSKLLRSLNLLFSCVHAAYAFTIIGKARPVIYHKMSAENFVGSLPPTGFFDPMGLSKGMVQYFYNDIAYTSIKLYPKPDLEIKKWQEAEIKHGRVAMLASVGIIVAEKWNPLFDGKIIGAGIFIKIDVVSTRN